MATFYLSSTFEDLEYCRQRVSSALTDAGHVVVGMENYTASGASPLSKCLADVARCEVYLGIFAWRYGCVPDDDNPQRKSITELEYLKAVELKIETLIFILDKSAPWPPTLMDSDLDNINQLRDRLAKQHIVKFFMDCGDLTVKVLTAATRYPLSRRVPPSGLDERIPERNPYFRGRVEEIERMHEGFRSGDSPIQAIFGLGGIGKTQIAVEYAHLYRNEYATLLWAGASSASELSRNLEDLSKDLGLVAHESQDSLDAHRKFRGWLEKNDRWLLIFDNADDVKLVKPHVLLRAKGHILLTSRAQVFQLLGPLPTIEIEKMTIAEARSFLTRRTGRQPTDAGELEALDQLLKELDGLPLALEQAAAYIAKQTPSFADYLKSYQDHDNDHDSQIEFLDEEYPVWGEYPLSVRTTWKLNFEEVEKHAAAADVLRFSAFLGPDNIPFELLTKGWKGISSTLAILGTFDSWPVVLHETLQPLTVYSLIRKDTSSRSYSIHRLVQLVIRDNLTIDERKSWANRTVCVIDNCFPEPEFKVWGLCERLIAHAVVCKDLIEKWDIRTESAETLLTKVSAYLLMRGQYSGLEEVHKSLLSVRTELHGDHDLKVVESHNDLGSLYKNQGRYPEAEEAYNRAIAILEMRRDKPWQLARTLNNLGVVYSAKEMLPEAEKTYKRALLILESLIGPEQEGLAVTLDRNQIVADIARVLTNLATLYQKGGRGQEAGECFARARILRAGSEPSSGDRQALIADQLSRDIPPAFDASRQGATDAYELAAICESEGRYEEAENLYESALGIVEKLPAEDELDVATHVSALARIYEKQGKHELAKEYFLRSLRIWEGTVDETHLELMRTRTSFAGMLVAQKLFAEAEQLLKKALSSCEQVLGEYHPETAQLIYDLALACVQQNRLSDAEPLYRRALKIRKRVLVPNAEETLVTMGNLAWVLANQGQYEEAEELFQSVNERYVRTLGPEHRRTVLSVYNLAQMYMKQERYEEAEPLFRQVLESGDDSTNSGVTERAKALEDLAWICAKQNSSGEAEQFYRRALQIRDRTLGPVAEETLDTVLNLARVCDNQGHYDEAEKLFQRLIDGSASRSDAANRRTLQGMYDLAEMYKKQGRYEEAERLFRQLLEGEDGAASSDQTAKVLEGLAICVEEKDVAGAEQLYHRALEVRDRLHPDGKQTLITVDRLAQVCSRRGDYEEAARLLKRLVDSYARTLGSEDPQTVHSKSNLAQIYVTLKRHEEAEPLSRQVLKSLEDAGNSEGSEALTTLKCLVIICKALKRDSAAQDFLRRVLAIQDRLRRLDPNES